MTTWMARQVASFLNIQLARRISHLERTLDIFMGTTNDALASLQTAQGAEDTVIQQLLDAYATVTSKLDQLLQSGMISSAALTPIVDDMKARTAAMQAALAAAPAAPPPTTPPPPSAGGTPAP